MNNIGYVLLFLLSVFVSSCSQIALKKSANRKHESKIKEIMNPLVLGAYVCLLFIFAPPNQFPVKAYLRTHI